MLVQKNVPINIAVYYGSTSLTSISAAFISKNGGGVTSLAGTATVSGNYVIFALTSGDTDTIGQGVLQAVDSVLGNVVPVTDSTIQVVDYDPSVATSLDAAGVRSAVGLATASLDTQLGASGTIGSAIQAVNLKTTNLPATPAAVGSAMTLQAGERDAIANALLNLANAIETGVDPRGAFRLAVAACSGLLGIAGNTVTIKNPGGTKDRIVATVNSSNERTAVAIDVS